MDPVYPLTETKVEKLSGGNRESYLKKWLADCGTVGVNPVPEVPRLVEHAAELHSRVRGFRPAARDRSAVREFRNLREDILKRVSAGSLGIDDADRALAEARASRGAAADMHDVYEAAQRHALSEACGLIKRRGDSLIRDLQPYAKELIRDAGGNLTDQERTEIDAKWSALQSLTGRPRLVGHLPPTFPKGRSHFGPVVVSLVHEWRKPHLVPAKSSLSSGLAAGAKPYLGTADEAVDVSANHDKLLAEWAKYAASHNIRL